MAATRSTLIMQIKDALPSGFDLAQKDRGFWVLVKGQMNEIGMLDEKDVTIEAAGVYAATTEATLPGVAKGRSPGSGDLSSSPQTQVSGASGSRRFRSLDELAGRWKEDPEFDRALEAQRRIDRKLWK
jgi:hypothetical protein